MAGLLDGVDITKPCEVWPKLEEARLALLAGQQEVRIRYADGREVEFGPANLAALATHISALKAECARLTSGRRPGRAIRAGFNPRTW